MRLRASLRLAAQWLLAPVAILVAILTTEWGSFWVVRAVSRLDSSLVQIPEPHLLHRPLTPDQRLVLKGDKVIGEERLLVDRKKRIRDVRVGPDGFLYVATDEDPGEILRIRPRN